MNKIKMIGLDLDGTLLNNRKELTERTIQALKSAMEQGVEIVISTGRPITGVPKHLLEFSGIRYVISSNGGRVIDQYTQELLYECPVQYETAERILKIVKEYDTLCEIYFDGKGYVQKDELEKVTHYLRNPAMANYILTTREGIDSVWEKMDEMRGHGLDKVHAIFADENELEEARIRVYESEDVIISGSLGNNLEMNAPGVHKGIALLRLGEKLGIAREEIMAFGDGDNDIEMLKAAGVGVAMANASEEVKSAADLVTESNEEDGVAQMIERIVLKR